MTQRPEFTRADFEGGEHWMYETRCRKCGGAWLGRWAERKRKSWPRFLRDLLAWPGDSTIVNNCVRCGVVTVQDIVALSPEPMTKGPRNTVEPRNDEADPHSRSAYDEASRNRWLDLIKEFLLRHPMAKEPGCTVEPSKGEGPRPGGQAHGAEPGNTKAMGRSTEHNLIINAKHLAALLEKTTGTTIEVRPVKNYPNGGNCALLIDEMGIGVNSDEPFTYNLSHTQRAHLNNLLIVVGDQPVNIRFNLRSRYVEVSGVLV